MSTSQRNDWIDVLRAVGALSVVLFHINVMPHLLPPGYLAQSWHAFWHYGHLGVGLFFTLSGYCLIPGWSRSIGCGLFLRRRFWRIMPPYWASLLLVILLAAAFKSINGINDIAVLPRTAESILSTLLLLTQPITSVPTINWVYWTLSTLLAYYSLLGLLLLVPTRDRFIALAALHGTLCLITLPLQRETNAFASVIQHWPVFGIGCALALWPRQRRAAGAMLLCSALHAAWAINHNFGNSQYIIVSGLTVAFVASTTGRSFPPWLLPLSKIGRISYSVYLVHVPIGIFALYRLIPEAFSSAFTYVGAQLTLLGATLAAACLFYLIAEKPFNPASRHGIPG